MFQTKFVVETKTHFMLNNFFIEYSAFYGIMWKNMLKDRQATDYNMAHATCMLDTKCYKLTLRICNISCLFTATIVTQKRHDIALYRHCLSCCYQHHSSVKLHRGNNVKIFVMSEQLVYIVTTALNGLRFTTTTDVSAT